MKKTTILILLILSSIQLTAQYGNGIFSKDPIIHLENFQKKKLHFGYYLGFNTFDFKMDYKNVGPDIQTKQSVGFNVGIVSDVRMNEYFNLRFEPGLYFNERVLYFPGFTKSIDITREVSSTYIHFPLLVKISSLRTGNIRPYLVAGLSTTLNLSSNHASKDDNAEQVFRLNKWSTNYELGLGIDIFTEYFIFSPSIRGLFGISNDLIQDNSPNSPWTSNIESLTNRGLLINFTFH